MTRIMHNRSGIQDIFLAVLVHASSYPDVNVWIVKHTYATTLLLRMVVKS